MDITPVTPSNLLLIESYGMDGFRIQGIFYPQAILISPEKLYPLEEIPALTMLEDEQFYLFLLEQLPPCSMMLVGTGQAHHFIRPSFRRLIQERYQLVLDSMDTGAACRTYNVLASEGRTVIALLLPS